MELKFVVVADTANVSAEGKLNIAGEFNSFHASAVPMIWPQFTIVARLEAPTVEGEQHAAQFKIQDDDGKSIFESPPLPIKFGATGKGVPLRATMMMNLVGIAFPKFGDYGVHIFVDGVRRGDVTLYVRQVTVPPRK